MTKPTAYRLFFIIESQFMLLYFCTATVGFDFLECCKNYNLLAVKDKMINLS